MPDRNPDHLTPKLKALWVLHMRACQDAGIRVLTTFTLRTNREQIALFAQGRRSLGEVNALRQQAGLPPIGEKENRRPVTWTMKSKHLAAPPDNLSRAYDLAVLDKDGVCWDAKRDLDADGVPEYEEIARLAEGLSLPTGERLKAGIRFGDPAHFELA